jgi:hypothetical protein
VAKAMNKITLDEGLENFENPYKVKDKKGRPSV